MRKILAVTSGRADASPMQPVLDALEGRAEVSTFDAGGWSSIKGAVACLDAALTSSLDLVLLLGDRYEIMLAATLATIAGVPIAHIHGGEATFGSFDNQFRDAITKLAHIHFVAATPMHARLRELGEEDHRINVVGAPGLDNLEPWFGLGVPKRDKTFMLTYHPATLGDDLDFVRVLMKALSHFEHEVIWTGVNADPGANAVAGLLEERYQLTTLSPSDYHMKLLHSAACVGNSSSGIIEAPALYVPTVDVGPRQDGRLKAPSVFHVRQPDLDEMLVAVAMAIKYEGPWCSRYGAPGASKKIAEVLTTIELEGIMVKRWF